ncbi:MAG: site-specific DNA-methyltransferase, partial [Mycoplasma sp.]|nr:site-specific DNA-methyltransferase [Mycoplasma sp.]
MLENKEILNQNEIAWRINDISCSSYLDYLKTLPDSFVDFICIDPPYGKINGMLLSGQKEKISWDTKIDWKIMFDEFNRVLKNGGTIAIFGQQPTYSEMILSNIKQFKYELIWVKNNAAQGFNADKMPLIYTENIAIFVKNGEKRTFNKLNVPKEINKQECFSRWYAQQLFYHIGKTRREIHKDLGHRKLEFYFMFTGKHFGLCSKELYHQLINKYEINKWDKFVDYNELKKIYIKEKEIIKNNIYDSTIYNGTLKNIFFEEKDYKPYFHPTQKPLKLMEKLILMYTNKDDIVLDCFLGSGST